MIPKISHFDRIHRGISNRESRSSYTCKIHCWSEAIGEKFIVVLSSETDATLRFLVDAKDTNFYKNRDMCHKNRYSLLLVRICYYWYYSLC
jgi:hypothetical protein